jgi:hypothetical protein
MIMRTSAQIFLLAVLILTLAIPPNARAKLLVTRDVLAEYVEDRLSRLEGREKLDREEAAELNFIRENKHNLHKLADFYGMRIKEKIPQWISARERPSAREIQGKPAEEIPPSPPITPDTVELERETGLIEATPAKTSEPEEKSVSFMPDEEMAEGKRAEKGEPEKVEGKIAKKDVIADERAISPLETSSPPVESQTAVTAQKSVPQPYQLTHADDLKHTVAPNKISAPNQINQINEINEIDQTNQINGINEIHQTNQINQTNGTNEINEIDETNETDQIDETNQINQIAHHKPASLVATDEEVRQFLATYVERYTQKDRDSLLSLFSPKAIQNQRNGFDEIKEMYSDFFNKSHELRYRIADATIDIYQNAVEVTARYEVDQISKKKGNKKLWTGHIRWILVREDGKLRIRFIDFRPQESP